MLRAKQRLRASGATVIGVVGSYGKTSTKYYLHTVLSEAFRTLKTPLSYNTPMGICKVLNGELKSDHQVFVCEMGAYRRGDIRYLSRFVRPRIGVLTALGPTHLERFGTVEAIAETDYECIEELPADGLAVYNADSQGLRRLFPGKAKVKRVIRYGVESPRDSLDLWAEDIKHTSEGLSFTAVFSSASRIPLVTPILGRHNVLNILAAVAVAHELAVPDEAIIRGVKKLEPAPHRLQLIHGSGGVTVIDDSYNSNPAGAREALHVLSELGSGKKVLVTPGMVELGVEEDVRNEEFGAHAASICQAVILVGERQTAAVRRGLEKAKFSASSLFTVQTLQEAQKVLGTLLVSGDVVLFENDLPDLYAEK